MGTATSLMMGVADMPIQTLKLLNIHPDSRSKKGKDKATTPTGATTPSGESICSGRPQTQRTTTNTTDASAMSGVETILDSPSRSESMDLARTQSDSPGTPTHRSTFMSQAFADSTSGSRSSSRERIRQLTSSSTNITHQRSMSATSQTESQAKNGQQAGLAETMESAVDTGKGLVRIVGAGFKSPMDFSLNIAKGFHNVPKLYGADVRQVDKVTDFQSGIRTAAKVGNVICTC